VRSVQNVLSAACANIYFRHTLPSALKVHVYHGRGRDIGHERLSQFDIVLTTYETAANDASVSGTLSRMSWLRIVLDEGTTASISPPFKVYILSTLTSSSNPKSVHTKLPRDYKTASRTAMVSDRHSSAKQTQRSLLPHTVPRISPSRYPR